MFTLINEQGQARCCFAGTGSEACLTVGQVSKAVRISRTGVRTCRCRLIKTKQYLRLSVIVLRVGTKFMFKCFSTISPEKSVERADCTVVLPEAQKYIN